MKCSINKYDYLTGEIIKSYYTIDEACIDNHMCYMTIWKELQKEVLEYHRRVFYFGYAPKPRYVINCYDNETMELLGTYKTLKEAEEKTGVKWRNIWYQTNKDLPLNERKIGCTGLFFQRVLIMT